jgi:predicted HTH transcriptional regulator
MLLKDLSDVSLQDVQVLCDNHVLESRSLDFKATAIDRGDRGKREFLADVCALANASGGDLILGVKEKEGAADEVCGIEVADQDDERLFLTNLVRGGLEPRYSGLDTKWLPIRPRPNIRVTRGHFDDPAS